MGGNGFCLGCGCIGVILRRTSACDVCFDGGFCVECDDVVFDVEYRYACSFIPCM